MIGNSCTRRRIWAKRVQGFMLSAVLLFIVIGFFPIKAYSVGDFHLYSMPGAWAQDLNTNAVSLTICFVFIEKSMLFDPVSPWKFSVGSHGFCRLNEYGS
ncbi:MAG: hypothetical protein RBT11_20220, partial [Desulfobacterales bacterium]|nr:hypothetical protein [Desulfobacterales bacterium]